jgi:hypothetical protein
MIHISVTAHMRYTPRKFGLHQSTMKGILHKDQTCYSFISQVLLQEDSWRSMSRSMHTIATHNPILFYINLELRALYTRPKQLFVHNWAAITGCFIKIIWVTAHICCKWSKLGLDWSKIQAWHTNARLFNLLCNDMGSVYEIGCLVVVFSACFKWLKKFQFFFFVLF